MQTPLILLNRCIRGHLRDPLRYRGSLPGRRNGPFCTSTKWTLRSHLSFQGDRQTMTADKKGILYMIIASTSFSLMAVMVKLSGGRIPLFEQVFFRNLIMLLFGSVSLIRSNTSIRVAPSNRFPLFLRCLLGFLGVVAIFYANNHLSLADAQILQKLNPFFVILTAVLFLGERMTASRLVTILAGFIGAAIIINPTGNFNLFPSLVGISSALFAGLAYAMIRNLAGRVQGMVIIFWFSLFSFAASLPLMLLDFVPPTPTELGYLLMIGVFAAFGQFFITKSYLTTEASKVTLYDYTGVIVSPVLGFFIFSEGLKLNTLIGTLIIIGSGYLAARLKDNRKL